MGRCARRTKKIAAAIARSLTPAGVRLIGDIVGIVNTTTWESHTKRRMAVELAEAALKARGIEAREHAIRAAVEVSVAALHEGEAALADLGRMEDDEDQDGEP